MEALHRFVPPNDLRYGPVVTHSAEVSLPRLSGRPPFLRLQGQSSSSHIAAPRQNNGRKDDQAVSWAAFGFVLLTSGASARRVIRSRQRRLRLRVRVSASSGSPFPSVAVAEGFDGDSVALEPKRRPSRSEATRARQAWMKKTETERAGAVVAVRCRQILLASEGMADVVRQQLRSSPDEFAKVAESLSLCTATAKAGGDIGWVGKFDEFLSDLLPAEVREAALAGQAGDLLKVHSDLGWHVLRVEDVMLDLKIKNIGERLADSDDRGTIQGTYTVETMGCQMNAADSERMEGQLMAMGLRASTEEEREQSSVVVLNTCSIRDKAEQKVFKALDPYIKRKRKGEDLTIVVTGCVAQQEGEQLLVQVPEVDVVVGPQYVNRLADVLDESRKGGQVCATADARIMEDVTMPNRHSQVSAWVNVIYGCNERCTYCVVPTTRGSEQSRPLESIRRELSQLAAQGYREITLLGQNIDAYGRDLTPRRNFADLLRYVGDIEGIDRIRFLTSHPKYMNDDLIIAARDVPAVCEQFHVPFQSGDDEVLRRMDRGYTHDRFMKIIEKIRAEMPNAGISADAIVGFPGETDAQFERTLELMRKVRFDTVMTAAYSPRPNTPAASWDDQLEPKVKKERLGRIKALAKEHALARSQKLVGDVVEVLVEGRSPRRSDQVRGRSRCGRHVNIVSDNNDLMGLIVPVSVTEALTYSVVGEPVGAPW